MAVSYQKKSQKKAQYQQADKVSVRAVEIVKTTKSANVIT